MPRKGGEELTELAIAEIVEDTNIRELDTKGPAFKELVADIEARGILEPLLVRYVDAQGEKGKPAFVLVAGYRRLAAAKEAKLKVVPVRTIGIAPNEVIEVQLAENMLRVDLNPMEEARAIHLYSEATGSKPKEIAARLHKSTGYVQGRLHLLNLVPEFQKLLLDGVLPVGSAVLLGGVPAEVQREELPGDTEELNWWAENMEARSLENRLRHQLDRYKDRLAVRKAVEGKPFAKCPGKTQTVPPKPCEELPVELLDKKHVRCNRGHIWDPDTGKLQAVRERISSYSPGSRETRKPQEIDRSESPVVRTRTDAWTTLRTLIDGLGSEGVRIVTYDGDRIIVHLDGKHVDKLARCRLRFATAAYSSGEGGQVILDDSSASTRGTARKAVEKWLGDKGLLPGKDRKAPKALNTEELLEGSVADVAKRLKKLDREELDRLRDAEVEGKCRGGVLDQIDRELDASSPGVYLRD
jgi:ParB/RepB/Spo0J family partition protein